MQGRVNRKQVFLHPADDQKKSCRVCQRPRFQLGPAVHTLPAVDAVSMQQCALKLVSNQADSWWDLKVDRLPPSRSGRWGRPSRCGIRRLFGSAASFAVPFCALPPRPLVPAPLDPCLLLPFPFLLPLPLPAAVPPLAVAASPSSAASPVGSKALPKRYTSSRTGDTRSSLPMHALL